jgi:hypothetical protein
VTGQEPMSRRDGWTALALAAALTVTYSVNGEVLPGNDATANVYFAANLLETGHLSVTASEAPGLFTWQLGPGKESVGPLLGLDTPVAGLPAAALYARGVLVAVPSYYLTPSTRTDARTHEPRFVNTFGLGAALTALPVLAPLRLVAGDLRERPELLWFGGKLAASLLVAASAALVFLTARRWLVPGPALALALAYGLGTSVWSTSSQTLWQHASNELFLALGAFFLVRAQGSLRHAALAGAALAAAVLCRPTSAVVAAAAGAFLLLRDRRALAAFAAGALPLAAALATYNLHFLGSALRFAQTEAGSAIAVAKTGSPDVWQTPLWTGLAGVLVSPSRGLFVFSPWLLLAIPGVVLVWRRAEYAALRPLSVGAGLLLAVESKWFDWWGGWAFGYRRVVDVALLLALLAIPVAGSLARARWLRVAAAVALAWSIAVQVIGAFAYDFEGWNGRRQFEVLLRTGDILTTESEDVARQLATSGQARRVVESSLDVDAPQHRDRLWSVSDNQIGYYVARFGPAGRAKAAASRDWIDSWRTQPD